MTIYVLWRIDWRSGGWLRLGEYTRRDYAEQDMLWHKDYYPHGSYIIGEQQWKRGEKRGVKESHRS